MFALSDYIQLARLGNRTLTITVQHPAGAGEIVVQDGELWSARDSAGEGEDAFRRLLARAELASGAQVVCRQLGRGLKTRTIFTSSEALLLEVARIHDEENRSRRMTPPAPGSGRDEKFETHFSEGIEALVRKDFACAAAAFECAARIRPDDELVRVNLARLEELLQASNAD